MAGSKVTVVLVLMGAVETVEGHQREGNGNGTLATKKQAVAMFVLMSCNANGRRRKVSLITLTAQYGIKSSKKLGAVNEGSHACYTQQ